MVGSLCIGYIGYMNIPNIPTVLQLQLILLALTYTRERTVYTPIILYIRLFKWLGYCKISKALISVCTINRNMGLKVCVGSYFSLSEYYDNDEHDLFMLYRFLFENLKKKNECKTTTFHTHFNTHKNVHISLLHILVYK